MMTSFQKYPVLIFRFLLILPLFIFSIQTRQGILDSQSSVILAANNSQIIGIYSPATFLVPDGTARMGSYLADRSTFSSTFQTATDSTPVVLRVVPQNGLITADCGLTWVDACDLQYTLQTRTDISGGTTWELWGQSGTYYPTLTTNRSASFNLKNGVAIYGGFSGTETGRDERNLHANTTILSGDIGAKSDNSDNSYHIVIGISLDSSAVLDGFTITAGQADGTNMNSGGGGMLLDGSSPTLSNLVFAGNHGATSGGGLIIANHSEPVLTNILFTQNSVPYYGGAILIDNASPILNNVTITQNVAGYWGSGIMNTSGGHPILTHATIYANGNDGSQCGEICNANSNMTLHNSILWYIDSKDPIFGSSNDTLESSYSDIRQPTGTIYPGIGNLNVNPLLGSLGFYGSSFEQTLPLLPGSPAIDQGHVDYCLPNDQRGMRRSDGHCDLGAYEARPFTLAIGGGSGQTALVDQDFLYPIWVGVSSVGGDPVDGGMVTFTSNAGSGSASCVPSSSIISIVDGKSLLTVHANETPGFFNIQADTNGAVEPVDFELANTLPAPNLTEISPTATLVGSDDTTLVVTGNNFKTISVVEWNGSILTTSYISPTELHAQIPAQNLRLVQVANIVVWDEIPTGGYSNPLNFTVESRKIYLPLACK